MFCVFSPAGLRAYPEHFIKLCRVFINIELSSHHIKNIGRSFFEYYENGIRKSKNKLCMLPHLPYVCRMIFLPLIYLIHMAAVISAGRQAAKKGKIDWFVGVNYYCAFCGIILQKLGYVQKVIYRVLDFYPRPPDGIYHYLIPVFNKIDSFCIYHSNAIWHTTAGHIQGRIQAGYSFNPRVYLHKIPLGVIGRNILHDIHIDINRQSLVYAGVINRNHGLEIILKIVPRLQKRFPDLKLHIIGSGPFESEILRVISQNNELKKAVHLHGYLAEDSQELQSIVSRSALGLALYEPEQHGFMQFTEPAKVKLYLSRAVPVLITRVPEIAGVIEQKGAGFIVAYDEESILQRMCSFFEDTEGQDAARKNALDFIRAFDTDFLLDAAVKATLEYFVKPIV